MQLPSRELADAKTADTPEQSTFFATVCVDEVSRCITHSDGDLWPSAWSDDDWLYCANGDGKGFDLTAPWSDIVVNRVSGHPERSDLVGERLASGNEVGSIWGDAGRFNRKPTGLISVEGVLYLAVQDLCHGGSGAFDQAPSASILRSIDKGRSWSWRKSEPMFSDNTFTTIMFLDFGRDGADNVFDEYVYAYGLDNNWRGSFSHAVPDPTELYLARMPREGIQDVSRWEFYSGGLVGDSCWSAPGDIGSRRPVLVDRRRRYTSKMTAEGPDNLSVLSQGGVVFNRPLGRFIYTSWTEYTFEFYEAPKPWGPWRLFLSKDFGAYPWSEGSHGGYAIVIPSKFISDDGREMWLSSSSFMGGVADYHFSLRKLRVAPYEDGAPENERGPGNLALLRNCPGVVPISAASMHFGQVGLMNDESRAGSEDSWNGERKEEDYWGYTWPRPYNMNTIKYTTGKIFADGGWFNDLRVQVRRKFVWRDVKDLVVRPPYPGTAQAGQNMTYVLTFADTWGDGVRIVGEPGGDSTFSSISELEVYYSPG